MTYFTRIIKEKLESTLSQKSLLLLGPRQTGKSTFIHKELRPDRVFNLLDQSLFLQLSRNLTSMRESLAETDRFIVVDEIQKLPQLMDEIHLMIERDKKRFLLTGSCARKIRRSYTSLMGGRTRSLTLHPLVYPELKKHFSLERALGYGTLPFVTLSREPFSELLDDVGDYLQQEILAEAVTRGIDQYSRFLSVMAQNATQTLNIEGVARDSQVAPSTVRRYLDIPSDTMIAEQLSCWNGHGKRKSVSMAKLVFFDVGVVSALLDTNGYSPVSPLAGMQLEQYVGQELLAFRDYHSGRVKVEYWRSQDRQEVDFVLAGQTAIEVKHTKQVASRDLRGLKAIADEGTWKKLILVCREQMRRSVDGVEILPVQEFLDDLWSGKLVG